MNALIEKKRYIYIFILILKKVNFGAIPLNSSKGILKLINFFLFFIFNSLFFI
jgi:hypothetical protein